MAPRTPGVGLSILLSVVVMACSEAAAPEAPAVQRLLAACPRLDGPPADPEPHLSLGDDTRIAIGVRTPWRCEAPARIGRDSVLTFAVGQKPGEALALRVAFRDPSGRTHDVHEQRLAPTSETEWRDVAVDLTALADRPGTLVFDVTSRQEVSVGFGFAEPVLAHAGAASPGLVLILLDTLRADRVGFGAGERDTTPFLTTLGETGTVFSRAYSPSSWTRPSTASLMVGLDPSASGVHSGLHRIGREQRTLARALYEAGYATTAFTRNPNVLPLYGFDRGFERFVDAEAADWGRTTDTSDVIDRVVEELARFQGRPFFLYLHVNQIHAPYLPPPEFRRAVPGDPPEPSDLYDADVRFVDTQLRRLRDVLEAAGRNADTVWAVTADHGEEFGEHGQGSHGLTLYEEQLRIPMLLWGPGRVPAQVIERPVRLSALADTLLGVLGLDTSVAGGDSLLAAPTEAAPLTYSVEGAARRVHAISDGRWKYITWMRPRAREELYDLAVDPEEQHDRMADAPAEADRLARVLHRLEAARRPGLHLRVASAVRRNVHAVLTTTGRIEHLWSDDVEGADRVTVSADGTRLELRSVVEPVPGSVPAVPRPGDDEPPGIAVQDPDVDEIGFVVDPPGSAVELSMGSDAVGEPVVWVGSARAVPPVSVAADAPELSVRAVPTDETSGAVMWLYRFAGAEGIEGMPVRETRIEKPVPEDVRQRLRALGYMH